MAPIASRDNAWPLTPIRAILMRVTDVSVQETRYFEDYPPERSFDCGSFTLDQAEIIAFAGQYDPQPFHVDPVAAKDGPYGGIIASGWHTTSMMMRQVVENFLSPQTSLGAAGVDEIRWPRPVRPGDTLHVRAVILEARRSQSKPDRGIVRTRLEVTNQNGDTAMTAIATNFVLARHAEA